MPRHWSGHETKGRIMLHRDVWLCTVYAYVSLISAPDTGTIQSCVTTHAVT